MIASAKGIYTKSKVSFFGFVIGASFWILVPYVQFGVIYSYWAPEKKAVDRETCTNRCWDTVFKGTYQSGAFSRYKHVYFNVTYNTFLIWAITIFFVLIIYEILKYLTSLFFESHLRPSMVLLFCSVVYPHYYAWWVYFNYLNDDFYIQWSHQTFFTITEAISTGMVVYLCDNKKEISPKKLLVIISVATLHVLASGWDQFVENIFLGKGKWHQNSRDIGFMVPDLLHIILPLLELRRYKLTKTERFIGDDDESLSKKDLALAGVTIISLLLLLQSLG